MNSDTVRIGRALRAEIDRRGLLQEQVAAMFNVTQPRISRILKGEFTHRSELAPLLCAAFLEGPNADYAHNEIAGRAFEQAVQALHLMWDGSADHAERLVAMIEAVGAAKRRAHSKAP